MNYILITLMLFFATPQDAYILVGQSNGARGVAAASFTTETGYPVVNCAKNGMGVRWILGNVPYSQCIRMAKGYNIIGILSISGEVETKNGDDWLALSRTLKAKFETTYGKPLPFYHVRIHKDFPPQKYTEAVRFAQWNSGWCVVNTDDLTLDSNWHYDPPSAVIIGQRLADCR